MTRPLFIPLKGEWFDAFARGEKRVEYRLYGRGWNERTCRVGRRVTLSRGYSAARLSGVVSSFAVLRLADLPAMFALYPDAPGDAPVAAIGVRLVPAEEQSAIGA